MRLNHSEKGQAVLEYLLILIVGVSLVLAVFKLNEHFKGFAQAYLGNYFSCLIQAGELPSLGGGDKEREELGQSCDAQFKEFSLAHGKALKDSFAQRAQNSKDAIKKRAARSAKNIGGSRLKSKISEKSIFPRKKSYSKKGSGAGSKSDKKVSSYLSEDNQSGRFAYKGRKRKRFRKRGNQIIIEEVVVLRDKKEKKERIKIVSSKENKEKTQSEYIEYRKIAQSELQEQEGMNQWNIRSIFKFLIVAAFIIALFFLIGGQLLKISKDSD